MNPVDYLTTKYRMIEALMGATTMSFPQARAAAEKELGRMESKMPTPEPPREEARPDPAVRIVAAIFMRDDYSESITQDTLLKGAQVSIANARDYLAVIDAALEKESK